MFLNFYHMIKSLEKKYSNFVNNIKSQKCKKTTIAHCLTEDLESIYTILLHCHHKKEINSIKQWQPCWNPNSTKNILDIILFLLTKQKRKLKKLKIYLQAHNRVQSWSSVVLVTSSKGLTTSSWNQWEKPITGTNLHQY